MSAALSEEELIVLNVVQEYLNKNRQFNIEKILPFIVSRFRIASININKKGIEGILRSLVRKNILIEGSKLSHQDILANLKRLQIYNYILKNPGTYFNKILIELDLSNHVVVWHLNMLEKFNYIRKEFFDNHDIYFDISLDFKDIKKLYITSQEKNQKIINYLKNNEKGASKTQLSRELKMHMYTIDKYLKSLIEYQIIVKEKKGNKTLFIINQ
ncbi:MAG: hypothetical protein ACFFAO_13580 [Candidatus Hermodarchaeota archaeon]